MTRANAATRTLLLTTILILASHSSLDAQATSKNSATNSVKKPNIIFILADDQGWNGTSVQMHPDIPDSKSDFYRTPNIEKLAAQGLVFSRAYSPGPMCSPTRASLQTGKSPAKLRMTNVGRSRPATPAQKLVLPSHTSTLSTDETTIGETLKTAGYSTAWFGKWHLGGDGPGAHGYDEHDGPTGNADGNTEDPENPKDVFGITQRGMAFMEENVKAGNPFYLQLWHYAVHGPVQTRAKTEQAAQDRPAGQVHQSTNFAGMTEDLDTGVGMILDKIEELSIADNTFVVYMSDHGASRNLSSNQPLNKGKGTLWEGGLRVPLIIRGPGIKSGAYCNTPVVGWDMFPTFCEMAGINVSSPKFSKLGLEGKSLTPLLKTGQGTLNRPDKFIAFHYPHYGQESPMSTISADGFKLVKFYETNAIQLYDLNKDIGEQSDLSKKNPEKAESLHQLLNDYLADIDAGVPRSNPEFDPDAVAQSGGRGGARGGRGGPRQAQIAARKKEMDALETAIKQDDLKKVGQLIAEMKKTLENAPQRSRGQRAGSAGDSPRQQRQNDLQALELAHQKGDVKSLTELITQIKQRINSTTGRPSGRGAGQRGRGQRPSDRNQ